MYRRVVVACHTESTALISFALQLELCIDYINLDNVTGCDYLSRCIHIV
jgi:hypothetical protein